MGLIQVTPNVTLSNVTPLNNLLLNSYFEKGGGGGGLNPQKLQEIILHLQNPLVIL